MFKAEVPILGVLSVATHDAAHSFIDDYKSISNRDLTYSKSPCGGCDITSRENETE